MSKFIIVGDSTCDLTKEYREKYDIEYARMRLTLGSSIDAREIYADLDWPDVTFEEFYGLMRKGDRAKTSQVTEEEFDLVFLPHLEKGEDVLYIGCSGTLSASVKLAERLNKEKYSSLPGKLVVVDSLNATLGQGMILIKASELRAEGKSIDEVAAWVNENKNCFSYCCTVETLTYLAKAGRIKASKAFFGNLFGVKPIIISDAEGHNYAIEKQKGRRNALLRLVEMTKENIIDPENQVIFVAHSDAKEEDLELVRGKLFDELHVKDVVVLPLGPIIGATTGPGCVAVMCFGKEITVVGE